MAEIFGKPFFVRSQTRRESRKGKVEKKKARFSVFHVERATHPLKTNQKKVTVRIEFSWCLSIHFSFFGPWLERISDARIYSAHLSLRQMITFTSVFVQHIFSGVDIATCVQIKRGKTTILRMIRPRRFFPDCINRLFFNSYQYKLDSQVY